MVKSKKKSQVQSTKTPACGCARKSTRSTVPIPSCGPQLTVLRNAIAARKQAETNMKDASRKFEEARAYEYSANQAYISCLGGAIL
jgi:hypothetical protein